MAFEVLDLIRECHTAGNYTELKVYIIIITINSRI